MRLLTALTLMFAIPATATATHTPPDWKNQKSMYRAHKVLYKAAVKNPNIDVRPDETKRQRVIHRRVRRQTNQLWIKLHPVAHRAHAPRAPSWWVSSASSVISCESGGRLDAVSAGGTYRGLLQFDMQTWRSVGGRGDPAAASRREQLWRGYLLWKSRGWSPWPVCGD